ncbi:hypothetical protein R84981_002901 [Carnimonas sp. R-84981]|uniref:phage baseplate plug family protein n=1 Tax=Carnimonas bestiolae TaxID=3402172 RepID=UPI003EDB88E6
MSATISLPTPSRYMEFTAQLTAGFFRFKLSWLERVGYYSAEVYGQNNQPIILGRGLHPDINLLGGIGSDFGALVLEGKSATLENLGIDNELKWYDNTEWRALGKGL